jgi:cation transporter-like permease
MLKTLRKIKYELISSDYIRVNLLGKIVVASIIYLFGAASAYFVDKILASDSMVMIGDVHLFVVGIFVLALVVITVVLTLIHTFIIRKKHKEGL